MALEQMGEEVAVEEEHCTGMGVTVENMVIDRTRVEEVDTLAVRRGPELVEESDDALGACQVTAIVEEGSARVDDEKQGCQVDEHANAVALQSVDDSAGRRSAEEGMAVDTRTVLEGDRTEVSREV